MQKIEQLLFAVVFFDDLVVDIGAVEAGDVFGGVFQFEIVFDVGTGFGVGGGGEGDAGDVGVAVGQEAELAVFGAEVVPPLAHAVGFVDGEQADFGVVEKAQEAFAYQTLGGNVEQFQVACLDGVGNLLHLTAANATVHAGGGHACGLQGGHLVVHQGNQRRHYHGQPAPHQGGNLITQGFAAAGGHQHQQVLPLCQRGHDFFLPPPEGVIAENFAQDVEGGGLWHGWFSVCRICWI